jgi:single-stranded-DNA-specific exonuclease
MITADPDLDAHLARARMALRNVGTVVPHTDADGLAAGAIALRARGERASQAILLGPGGSPFALDAGLPEGPLAVLDWGMRALPRPALIVDHHMPEVAPRDDQVFVSGYGETPEPSTSALMRRIEPEQPAWLAAVGAVGDCGDLAFTLPECVDVPEAAVRRLATLVDVVGRLPDGPVAEALGILVDHDDAETALADPRIPLLEDARRSWREEFDRVVHLDPLQGDDITVLRCSSRCHVQPAVATTWSRRLAPRVVLVANDAWVPGRVVFSVRGTGPLAGALRRPLEADDAELAWGHDRATGGSLAPDEFAKLLDTLGVR